MTQATEIMMIARNSNDAMTRADELTNKVDQDFENEATIYTFDDGSVLVVSGSQVNAFSDIAEFRSDEQV